MANFDWYQCTISDDENSVISSLSSSFPEAIYDSDGLAKKYRFETGITLRNPQTRDEVKVLYGGQNGRHGTHVICTSASAIIGADAVRSAWPDSHKVTRADAYVDLHGDTLFKTMVRKARKVAKQYKISASYTEDPLNPSAGATQYLGSPRSPARLRVYQKGLELFNRSETALRLSGGDPKSFSMVVNGVRVPLDHYVRVEAQIRPETREGKQALAIAKPFDCFGYSSWLQDFARLAFDAEINRIFIKHRKVSDFEHKCHWLTVHYGSTIQEILDLYGQEAAGKFFAHLLQKSRRE